MKEFCKDLKQHATKIINYEKKEMILIKKTYEENKFYKQQNVFYICKKEFNTDKNIRNGFRLYHKLRDHCRYAEKYGGAAHNFCNLRHGIPKEISIVFENGSAYDYHFIIKVLAKEFEGQFESLGESTKKYLTFSVPFKRELGNGKMIICKLKSLIALDLCQAYYQALLKFI